MIDDGVEFTQEQTWSYTNTVRKMVKGRVC
jgi:hypothetical protein